MSNLTTRAGKGSPLTNNELDANFTNLNADKVEIGGDLSGTPTAPIVTKVQGQSFSSAAANVGEKLVWNGTAWAPATDPSGEPIGHADKSESSIGFSAGTRTFTISPVSASFVVWCKGVKHTYTSAQTVVIPNTTGLHFIYFNASGVLSTQMTYFTWEEHAPTAYIYWNATTQQAVYFGDERHGITLDWQTHEYLHRTRGAAIANGFGASGYTTTGTGATDADAQIDIGGGTFFDEDMQVDIVSTNTPVAGTWQQDLSGPALIPVLYLSGSSWVLDSPTNFPFKVVSGVPQYNLYSGGTWSTAPVSNNEYFVSWILATNNLTYPVIAIISQAPTNQLSGAEAMTFEGLNLNGFPSVEFRPLYKVIYQYKTGFTNSIKASTISVYDLRSLQSAGVAAALVQDHGNLSGLGDDDHAQYLHVSEVRTPSSAVKNSFLPSQTSNSGKYLTTDGINPSWGDVPSGSLTFTGDVTGTGNTGSSTTLTLANSGVTAGTFTKVTVDTKGRVTTGASANSSDIATALGFTPENVANKAVANGYASLDGSGKVPSNQLPSYVDDVLEYANLAAFPATGETGKIYIAIDTVKTYRWSGSAYVEITSSPGSTDAVPEGSTNLYFTNARARAAVGASGSLSYSTATGIFSYTQPTNVSAFTNDSGYLTGITGAQVTSALGYTPYNATNPAGYTTNVGTVYSVSGTGTVSGLTLTGSVTSSGSLQLGGTLSLTSGQVTTALGYTPYNATNPSGYTNNTGTVTSVSGTGTVSGLTLTGTVTGSGSLTLGGTLSLTSGQVTSALGYTPLALTGLAGQTSAAVGSVAGGGGRWLRVATLGTSQFYGRFKIWDGSSSGPHQSKEFTVSGAFNDRSKVSFVMLAGGSYNYVGVSKVRYLSATTYDPQYLEVYIDGAGSDSDWTVAIFEPRNASAVGFSNGSVPGGYTSVEWDCNGAFAAGSATGGFRIGYDNAAFVNGNQVLHAGNYNDYAPSRTGGSASGTWGIRITGFANQGTARLYSTDAAYNYDSGAPFYGYLTYDGSRWLFQVSPGTPAAVRVAYADTAGSATDSTKLPLTGGTITGSRPIQISPSDGALFITGSSGGWSMGTYFKGSSGTIRAGFGALGSNNDLAYAWIGTGYDGAWMTLTPSSIAVNTDFQLGSNYLRFDQSGVRSWNMRATGGNLDLNSGDGNGSFRYNGNSILTAAGGVLSGAIRASQITAGGSTNTDANLGVQGTSHLTGQIYYGGAVGNVNSWSSTSISVSGVHTFSASQFIFNRYGYGSQPLIDMQSGSITFGQPTYAGSGITVNNASADGRGINLYTGSPTSPDYGLFFAQTGNFGTYGAVSADWATYFTMNSTPHRGWIFREHNSLGNVAAISNQGNMTLRSHFEQGNNIARPNVSWSAGSTSTGMVIFYLPGTTANYGMVHMVFDIYEYNGNAVSTVVVGGHNWSTSWYNTGCSVIGQCGKSVRLGCKDGRFCVVFGTSGSSWEYGTIVLRKIHNASFYDNVMNMVGDWSATQTTTESFTNITGDLRVLKTPASMEVSGILYGYNSVRSNIFYDTDNTGYYSDPQGSSRLNTIYCGDVYNDLGGWFRNYGATGIYNQSYGNHFYSDSGNYWNVSLGGNSNGGIRFRDNHAGTIRGYVYADTSNNIGFLNEGGSWRVRVVGGDYFLVEGSSARAPIFYDSNDTSYYIDPNSASDSALRMRGGALFGPNTSWSQYLYVGANGRPSSDASVCTTDGNLHVDCKNGSLLYLNYYSGRPTICGGDLRSNIYYDQDNTGYYVDGASTSTLNYLLTRRIKFLGEGGDSGMGTESYAIYQEGGGWSWPYPDLRIAFHTGIKLGANSSYQGIRFYTDYDMSSQVMSVNNGSDPLGGGNVYVNSALQAGGSLRAPIFYDANDTTYYTDPAATTALRTVGDWRANSHDWSGEFSGKMQYHAGHWYIQSSSLFIFRNAGGANVMQCDSSGNVTFSGNVTAYSDRRLKSNITSLGSVSKYLSMIDAKRFTWNESGKADIGFIAQDVEEAGLPEFVIETSSYDPNTETHGETVKSLDYGRMVAVLWQAVKDQQSQIEAALAEVKSLKERLQ